MDVSTKQLVAAAKDLQKVLGAKPPLTTKGKDEKIAKDVTEAAQLLEPTDEIGDSTRETLSTLGVEGFKTPPKKEEKKEKALTKAKKEKGKKILDKKGPVPKEKKSPAKKETPKKKKTATTRYSRTQSLIDALKGKPKTVQEIAEEMGRLYTAKNKGAGKEASGASLIWIAKRPLEVLVAFDVVELKSGKYHLLK